MDIQSANIVYFTGTGSCKRVSESLQAAFEKGRVNVKLHVLNTTPFTLEPSDLLLLVFPVYACNAPLPMLEWIKAAPLQKGQRVAVISVSGGGEVTPNTACRVSSVKLLLRKGCEVIYERMLVMPSNWIVAAKPGLVVRLLRALPVRAGRISADILNGIENKPHIALLDRFFSKVAVLEHIAGKTFGRRLIAHDGCTGCSLCAKNCPQGNIRMENGKPVFDSKCVICLRCVYGCPAKALRPGMLKFVAIEEGYDYNAMEKSLTTLPNPEPVEVLAKGALWGGVKKYLLEDDQ